MIIIIIYVFKAQNDKCNCLEPEPPFFAGNRSRPNSVRGDSGTMLISGARAAQKYGGSATLESIITGNKDSRVE